MSQSEYVLGCRVNNTELFIPGKHFSINIPPSLTWEQRATCESDPTFKQVIPYTILYDIAKDIVLGYVRLSGDARLKSKMSIGVGGHINLSDNQRTFREIINTNINRELAEELGKLFDGPYTDWWNYFRGYIYDPSNPVGQVHLGLVFIRPACLDDSFNTKDSEHIFELLSMADLKEKYENMENWSKAVIDRFFFRQPNEIFYTFDKRGY